MKRYAALALALLLLTATACAKPSAPEPASSAETAPSSADESVVEPVAEPSELSAIVPDPYYLELVKDKEALVVVAAERARIYRVGDGDSLNPNHHAPWPADFPPAAELPAIETAEDFAIRHTKEASEMLGGVYLAIPVADGYEMRMDVARYQDFDGTRWGSGYTWFSNEDAPDWQDWVLSDLQD